MVALDNTCATDPINVNSLRIFTRRHVTQYNMFRLNLSNNMNFIIRHFISMS